MEFDQDSTATPKFSRSEQRTRQAKWVLCNPCGAPNARGASLCGVCGHYLESDADETSSEPSNVDEISLDAKESLALRSSASIETLEEAYPTITDSEGDALSFIVSPDHPAEISSEEKDGEGWSCFVPGRHRRAAMTLCALASRRLKRLHFATWKRRCLVLGEAQLTWECLDVIRRVEVLYKLYHAIRQHQRHVRILAFSRLRRHAISAREHDRICLEKLQRALALRARAKLRFAFAKLSTAHIHLAQRVFRLCRCFAVFDRLHTRRVHAAFGQWKHLVLRAERCAQLSRTLCWSSKNYQRRSLRTAFARLRRVLENGRMLERLARLVKRRNCLQALDNLDNYRLKVTSLKRVILRSCKRQKLDAVDRWRIHTRRVVALSHIVRSQGQRIRREALRQLCAAARTRANQKKAIARVSIITRRTLAGAALREWARDTTLLLRVEQKRRRRLLTRCMLSWRRFVRVRTAAKAIQDKRTDARVSHIFIGWRTWARVNASRRMGHVITKAFIGWTLYWRQSQAANERQVAQFLHRKRQRFLSKLLSQWRLAAKLACEARHLLHVAAKHRALLICLVRFKGRTQNRLLATLHTWRDSTAELAQMQKAEWWRAACIVNVALARSRRVTQEAAFAKWHNASIALPEKLQHLASESAKRLKKRVLRAWIDAVRRHQATVATMRNYFVPWKIAACLGSIERRRTERLISHLQFKQSKHSPHLSQHQHLQWQYRHQALTAAPSSHHYVHQRHVQLKEHQSEQDKTNAQISSQGLRERRHLSARHVSTSTVNDGEHDTQSAGIAFSEQGPGTDSEVSDDAGDSVETDRSHHSSREKLLRRPIHAVHHSSGSGHSATRFESSPLSPPIHRGTFSEDSFSVGSAPTPVLRAYFPHGSASARLRSRHLRYGFARAVRRQHEAQKKSDFNESSVRGDNSVQLHPQPRMHSSTSGAQSHPAHLSNLDGQHGELEAKFPHFKASRRRQSATLRQQEEPDSSSSDSSVSSSQASFLPGNRRQIYAKHRVHYFKKASRQGSKNAQLPENDEHRKSRMKHTAEMFRASSSYSSPSSSLNDRSPKAYENVCDVKSESEMASLAVQGHQENRKRSNARFRLADESGVANSDKYTLRGFTSRPDCTSRFGESESDISDEDLEPLTNADQRKVSSHRIRQHHHRRPSQTEVDDDLHVASNESDSSCPVVGASAHFSRSSRRTCTSKQLEDDQVEENVDNVTSPAHRSSEGTNQAKSRHLGHERCADGRFERRTTEQDDFVDVIGKRWTVHEQHALPRRRGRNSSARQSSKGTNQAKSCHLGHERCADGQVERPTAEQDNVADVVGKHRTGHGQHASSQRGGRTATRHIFQSQQEQGNSHLCKLEEERNVVKFDAVNTEDESHENLVHDVSAAVTRSSRVRCGKRRDEEQQAELIDEVEERWSQKIHQKEKDTGVSSQEDRGQVKTIFKKKKSKSASGNGKKQDRESEAESSLSTSDGDKLLGSGMECTIPSSEEEDHYGSQSVLMSDNKIPDAHTSNVSRFARSIDHSSSRKSKNRLRSVGQRHASEGAHKGSQTRERRTSSMSTQSCRHESDDFIERTKRRSSSSEISKAAEKWGGRESVQCKRSGKYKSGVERLGSIGSSNSQLYEETGAKSDIDHEARISFPSLHGDPVRHEKDDNESNYETSSVAQTCWSAQEFLSSRKRANTRDRLQKPEKARSKQMSYRSFADRADHFQTGKLLQVNKVCELNAEQSVSSTRYPSPVPLKPALREIWPESPTSSGLTYMFGDSPSPGSSITWGQFTDGAILSLNGCNCISCNVAAFEHATLISSFAMWRQWVHRRRWAILRILWSLSGDGTHCANVASCFARWQVWTAKEREACTVHRKKSDSVCAALERIMSARLAYYWDHWVDLTLRPVLQDAQAVFVAREVLHAWKLNTLVSLRRKSLLQRQASRWKVRSLYQAWHLWSMHLSSVQSFEASLLWADQSRLQDAFTAWRLVARDQANQARAYSLAHLASAFLRWRLARGVNAQKRAFVERAHFTTWKQKRTTQRLIRQRHAFDAWRGALHAQRGIRAGQRKLRIQFHRHRTEILRRTLLALHRRVSSGRLAQSFRIWARWTERCTHTSRAAERLVSSRTLFALRCGWNALQAHARGSRLLQSMLLQARARGRVAAKREAFQQWKCLASVRSVEAWYTAEHMDASDSFQLVTSLALKQVEARELLAETFASWKLWTKVNEATRRSCIWSQMTWMHWSWRLHTQKAAFQAWCAMVRRHKLLRNTMRHGTQRRKRLAFQRLRDTGIRAGNVCRFVKLVYFRSHKLALRHFFSRWRRRADQMMRLEKARRYSRHMRVAKSMLSQSRFRVGLEICHRVCAASRTAQLARGWRALWVHARCRMVLARALWRWRRSALRKAFGQWLRLQHMQKILERYLWSLYRRTLEGAMVIWRRQSKIARHIESATCARRLERCHFLFQKWAARARRLRKHKTLMKGWHERRRSVRLGIFYRAWARYVSVSKIRRIARVRAKILQVKISRLQNGLTRWKTYVTMLRSESERKNAEKLIRRRLACSIFQRAFSRNDRTRTLMAFRVWRDRSFLAHSLKARFLFQVLRKTTFTRMQNKSFRIWASATSLSKRLDTLDAMLVTRRLRSSFAQWESYAKKLSTHNLFLIQWRTAFLRKAFRGLLAAVQSQQRVKSHMRHVLRILHSQQSLRLASALSTWKAWAHQARITSAVLRRAKIILQRWYRAKQGAAFTQWKNVHSRSTQILRRTIARFQARGQRAAFSRLHEHARTQKLISRVMWRWSVRAVRQAFSSWRERDIEARVYAVKMQALRSAIGRWRHGLTRRTFAQWRSVVHAKKATLARACLFWEKHQLAQAFSQLGQCCTFDRVLCRVAARWERRHLATAFRTWREVLAQRDVASLRIQRGCGALLRNRSRAKAAAFAHWASWSRKTRSILVNVLRRWAKRIARQGLIHLKFNAQRSRQLEKVLRQWRLRHLATAWQKYKASCLVAKHQAQVMRRLLVRWHNQKLYLAFTTWSAKVTLCPARKELERVLLRWRTRLVRDAWTRWRAAAQAVQQRRQVCAKVLQQWKTRCARNAFRSWHEWATKAALTQARLAVAKRVVLHWSLGPVRWAFARLAKHAHCMTLMHSVVQRILQSRRLRVLSETWKKWTRASDYAARADRLCKRIIIRWRRRALVAAMSQWRSMCHRAKQVEHVFRKWNIARHTKVAAGFQRWKTNARRVRRLMQRVVRIALLSGARRGFEALRSNARSLAHQKRAVRVMRRWLNRRSALAFRQWTLYTSAKAAAISAESAALANEALPDEAARPFSAVLVQSVSMTESQRRWRSASLLRCLARWQKKRLHAAWSLWRNCVRIQRDICVRREAMRRFLRRWKSRRAYVAFQILLRHALGASQLQTAEVTRRRSLRVFVQRWKTRHKRAAFLHLKACAASAVLEAREIMQRRQCVRRLLSHSKTSKLRSAFQRWQQRAAGLMHAEQVGSFRHQILHRFLARWKARSLYAGFVQWQRSAAHFRAAEQERDLKMRFLRRLFQQGQVLRLRSALRIWQEYAVAEGHAEQIAMFRRNTLRGFIMRWKTGRQRAAFAVWKTTIYEKAQRDRLMSRVISRLRFRHIKDALGQWQKLARTLSCARRRLLQASLRDALRHWKELVERGNALKRATRRLLSWTKVYWKRRAGLAFLRLWRHATKICAFERTLLKWCRWRLHLGWKQWCFQVMRSKAAQQHLVLEKRCALFRLWSRDQLHRTRARKLEEAWVRLSGRTSKRTERLRSQTIARMIRRCDSLRIRRSLARWKVNVERQRLLDHLVVQAKRACDRRLKGRTLRGWQLAHRESRARAERLVRVHTMQEQRWALRLWSASHERVVRFEGLRLQRQSRLMEESWARWRKRMQLARAAKALRARVEQVMTLKSWEVSTMRLAFACLARHACACRRVARYESLVLRTGRISASAKEKLQQAKVFGAWRAWKVKVRKDRQIVRALGRIDDAWTMAHAQQAFCRLRIHALNEQAGRSQRHRLEAAASIRQVGDRARESLLQLQLSRSSASRF